MKRALLYILGGLGLLVLAALIVPFFIPTSVYTAQIEKAASEATGRDVKVQGDPRLRILPTLSARIDGVTITNPEGFSNPLMVEAGAMSAEVRLFPLFSGRVEVAEVALHDATVRLERLANGENNWTFDSPEPEAPEPEAPQPESQGFAGGVARARLVNTTISYIDRTDGTQYALTDFTGSARMPALDRVFESQGRGVLNGQAFDYRIDLASIESLMAGAASIIDAQLTTPFGDVAYDGSLISGAIPTLDGEFRIKTNKLDSLLQLFGGDLPVNAGLFKAIDASGTISGSLTDPKISFQKLDFDADGLGLFYAGDLSTQPQIMLNGEIDLDADRPGRLLKMDAPELAGVAGYISLIERLTVKGQVSGPVGEMIMEDLTVRHRSNLLDFEYDGDFALGGGTPKSGKIKASSDDLRALLTALNVDMADGETLRSFSLSGDTQGSSRGFQIKGLDLDLDDLSASGALGVDLSASRPEVTADLRLPRLDLSPFLGGGETSQTAAEGQDGWSEDRLALDALRLIDADIDIEAGQVIIDKIVLDDALLDVSLSGGDLRAAFKRDDAEPGFRAFDGEWSGAMRLNASGRTPSLSLNANADSVAAQKLLTAFTGFGGLSGVSGLKVDLKSSGDSLNALVNDLDGTFSADVANGALRGVNLAQMVRSADSLAEALANGTLSVATFRESISPEAETDFSSLFNALVITDGVATINTLALNNPVVAVSGSGQIDLGARTLDVRLVPSIDRNAQGQGRRFGVGDIPIPIRISGAWDKPSFGIDTAYVQTALAASLQSELENRLRDELGNALGISRPQQDSETVVQEEEPSVEDELRDLALGAIFGRGSDEEPED